MNMELDSIECVSDGMDEDEIHHHRHPQFSSSKPHNNVVSSAIHPTTSVHELFECPVCTNSMYPPIHQIYFMNMELDSIEYEIHHHRHPQFSSSKPPIRNGGFSALQASSSVFSDRKVKFSFWGFSEPGFDGSEDSKWRFLLADSYGFGGLNLGLQSGFNVEELSSIPNLRSYNYYSDDQHCGLCHKKKRVNGENFGLSPPINGCDFLGLNLRNKRIVDGENQDLSMGALGYGGGNVDQTQKELALKVKISKPATAGTYLSVFDFCSGRCRHNSESVDEYAM